MAFFQNSVLVKHRNGQNIELIQAAYQKFSAYFHNPAIQQNIRLAKEEQFQEGFLRELFVEILGYTLNPQPNFNLTTELKNENGAKKADGAILKNGQALAVIELKGTDTKDLDKINVQAFNYKNNQKQCVYVVTSNFEKLRFFIHNSVEHLEFNLFTLSLDEFHLLWICLSAENLLNNLPLKIKEESLLVEEKITKQLYKDYAAFRNDLWQNMVKNDSSGDKLLLFKKTQKLLDRYLFIFFAEDSGLLPPNSILRIVKRWEVLKQEDAYKPLYEIFKQYFGYIEKGRKGQKAIDDIFAYNGGLFLPDEVLDNIKIDDDLLHLHVMKLTNYDFQSEVDVNILGHIFENSLNEIETITAELEGQEIDKSKTKRKKDGVFYTPKYITKYIVDNTVGKLCEEKKTELGIIDEEYAKGRRNRKKEVIKSLDDSLQNYRNWLLNITICDPACGSGAFLNQALEFLIEEHAYIDELETQLLGHDFEFPAIENHILEKNIFGVDINEESVEIAKLSLWLRTAQRGRKLTTLNNNIKCGNSLIDDPSVAGEKAFSWQKEFPTVFGEKEKKAFHITTATHDSRTSPRMVEYKVREKRDNGLRPNAQPIWLEAEDEILITQTIAEIIKEDQLNVMAYNICGDHLHLLLVCEEEEVPKIMQKIKSKSSRAVNLSKEITTTREHAPLSNTKEQHAPLANPKEQHAPLSNTIENKRSRGEKQNSLWTQKFGCTEISNDKQLWNTIEYIRNNREKHELPPLINKGASSLIFNELFFCSYEHAFRTEHKGGFDVVIGNPPYVQSHSLDESTKNFIYANYETAEYQINTYAIFIEKLINILRENGRYSVIIPNYWLSTQYDSKLRKLIFLENKCDEVLNVFRVFEDATVDTVILTGTRTQKVLFPKSTFVRSIDSDLQTILQRLSAIDGKLWKTNLKTSFNDKNADTLISFDKKLILSGKRTVSYYLNGYQGMKPYEKGKGTPSQTREMMESKVYHSEVKKDNSYIPLIGAAHVQRFNLKQSKEFIKYGQNLAAPRRIEIFSTPRLLLNRILSKDRIDVAYTEETIINNTDVFNFLPKNGMEIFVKPLLVVLGSTVCSKYFKLSNVNLSRQAFPKLNVNNILSFPVSDKLDERKDELISLADFYMINFNELMKMELDFLTLVQSKFPHDKTSKKLQNWHELEFGEFLKELEKARKQSATAATREHAPLAKPYVALTLSEQAEWMLYFNEQKQKAQALKSEIARIDEKIDQMVYKLYNLTDEEIQLVEQA